MKRLIVLGLVLASGGASMRLAAFQQPAAPMVVEVDKIKDNLYVMKGGGGNSAVFVGSDGVTVVDTKNPGWGKPLLEKIQSVTSKPVIRIINTHTHGDHVSGNVDFPANVDVVVHENTRTGMEQMKPVTGLAAPPAGPTIFQRNEGRGLAKTTFKTKMTIGKDADRIDLYYFGRAHTGGDAFVVFRALNVMHAGDAFHTKDLPIMDANNGGSGVDFPKTLANAFAGVKGITTVINGHHPKTTTMAELKTQGEFVAEFVRYVQAGKKAGKSVDAIAAGWKTPARFKALGYAEPQAARVKADAQVILDETR